MDPHFFDVIRNWWGQVVVKPTDGLWGSPYPTDAILKSLGAKFYNMTGQYFIFTLFSGQRYLKAFCLSLWLTYAWVAPGDNNMFACQVSPQQHLLRRAATVKPLLEVFWWSFLVLHGEGQTGVGIGGLLIEVAVRDKKGPHFKRNKYVIITRQNIGWAFLNF